MSESGSARANYSAVDWADIQHAVKDACRGMPGEEELRRGKWLAFYVKGAKEATAVGNSIPEAVRKIVV